MQASTPDLSGLYRTDAVRSFIPQVTLFPIICIAETLWVLLRHGPGERKVFSVTALIFARFIYYVM